MDPIADKLLVLSAFVSFVQLELIPAWMMIILFARELVVTSVRLVAVTQHGTVIAAEKTGKHKTAWHIATIITILVIVAFKDYITRYIHPWDDFFNRQGDAGQNFVAFVKMVPYSMSLICVALSTYSGYDFFKRNWDNIFGAKR